MGNQIIARNGSLQLMRIDDVYGYVIDAETGQNYPRQSIASVLARGYWEEYPLPSESTRMTNANRSDYESHTRTPDNAA